MPVEATGVRRRWRPTTGERGYGPGHQAVRARINDLVLEGGVVCARCGEAILPTDEWHLGHDDHDRSRYSGPEHARCNLRAGGLAGSERRWRPPPPPEPEPEREGLAAGDLRWDVPWLEELREVPENAVWPRFMTVPHPRAAGSLGPVFIARAEERSERPLRWWQRLVATRLLETDADGRLVWETMVLTMARQLGKSWLLRELLLWRIEQRERFGEPQDVLHTGKDLDVCTEVLRPAMFWADQQPGYTVRRANGVQGIDRDDQSRWLVRARSGPYGKSVSVGAVDEAWKVKPGIVDEGLIPTMVEREQPQLWLISTAHREATALMLGRRQVALAGLEIGDGDLLIEWSAPKTVELDDTDGWRMASPHWTPQRQRVVGKQLEAAQTGEAEVSEDEMDPVEAFRAQWLNQWPNRSIPVNVGEPLLPAGLWAHLCEPGLASGGPLFVAVEDNRGKGAAVVAAALLDDGRIEVEGWPCDDWDTAILDVQRLGIFRRIRQLLVGASLLSRVPPGTVPPPEPAGSRETRVGLPLLRDLAFNGMLTHDTSKLDDAVTVAQVRDLPTGLALVETEGTHLVKALCWAVNAAHKPAPAPVVF